MISTNLLYPTHNSRIGCLEIGGCREVVQLGGLGAVNGPSSLADSRRNFPTQGQAAYDADQCMGPGKSAALPVGAEEAEARKFDRPYQVGDTLLLCEWDPETQEYSGDALYRPVDYLISGEFGIPEDMAIMSWYPRPPSPTTSELVEALKDIINPWRYLERMAKEQGAVLNGMAPAVANDPSLLREIASKALTRSQSQERKE